MSDLPDFIWHTDGKRWSDKYVKRLKSQRDAATKELVLAKEYGRKKREESKKLKEHLETILAIGEFNSVKDEFVVSMLRGTTKRIRRKLQELGGEE